MPKKKEHPKIKSKLHPRSKHRERYDFKELIKSTSELAEYVSENIYGDESINFSDPKAVKTLNKAILKYHYDIDFWEVPKGYLCPPIPGRADYLHHAADLLKMKNFGRIPTGKKIKVLDIGVGASCIYPIIGHKEYGWSFIGSEIDQLSLDTANKIIDANPALKGNIELKFQKNAKDIFYWILRKEEPIDMSICNPPFHASAEEAASGTMRKLKNLGKKKVKEPVLNFGGQNNELWYPGGEKKFIANMIKESKKFSDSCFWFTTLVSKQSNLKSIYLFLEKAEAVEVKTIPMGQGNKSSRIVAWTFLNIDQQKEWRDTKWK